MKTLNESFTDQEFEHLKRAKERTDLNWHDFLVKLSHHLLKLDYAEFADLFSKEEVKTK